MGLLVALTGCSKPNIEIQRVEVTKTPLDLSLPEPAKMRKVKWVIITPENAKEVFEQLKLDKTDMVLFSLTDEDYENLSLNFIDIRNFVIANRLIVNKYKEYYEENLDDGSETDGLGR